MEFVPPTHHCSCGSELRVFKTDRKSVITLEIGKFDAHYRILRCDACKRSSVAGELPLLVPFGCEYGFDVIELVGKALFLQGYSEHQTQQLFLERNIQIPRSTIGHLGKKFIAYLALAHQECQPELRGFLERQGGYILHCDATQEGGSPLLMSIIDSISGIVLGNIKIASEKADSITPLLEEIKQNLGNPSAVVSDMAKGIASAFLSVFPETPHFICHYHWLRDCGKDLMQVDYEVLRKTLKTYGLQSNLGKLNRGLRQKIEKEKYLSDSLESYLSNNQAGIPSQMLEPQILAYTLCLWILNAKRESEGSGFPFDHTHLGYYRRSKKVSQILARQQTMVDKNAELQKLQSLLGRILHDHTLARTCERLEEKVVVFQQLRSAMRLAQAGSKKSLNDDGDKLSIVTIKQKLNAFRYDQNIVQLASQDISYRKVVKQIDKYWEKLFADPITLNTENGQKTIYPQRTNNIMERFFRDIKRPLRQRSGSSSLCKTFKAILAQTPLVKNLHNPKYLQILLKDKNSLKERFAQIDAAFVRTYLDEQETSPGLVPRRLGKLLKLTDLPHRLVQKPSSRFVA